jgi:hypothetical protein
LLQYLYKKKHMQIKINAKKKKKHLREGASAVHPPMVRWGINCPVIHWAIGHANHPPGGHSAGIERWHG